MEDVEERKESQSNEHLFKCLLKMIESKDDHEKMPVRKFFNNTFDTLINDALFALMKKQRKSNSNSILTMQGSIRFVSQYLLDNLPENEREEASDEEEDEDEQDEDEEAQPEVDGKQAAAAK